jgi:predicted glycosyltransferase
VARVKILFYAINGTGLGHLSRLLAIARPMRELLKALGHTPDLRFVTTSEGVSAAHDFPVYKLPSKSAAQHLPPADFAASSKLLISHLVAQFSPHVLVMDTVAEGSYGELSFLLSFAGSAVLIDRHKDPSITSSEVYRRHVVLYDRVLVPDDPEAAERYPVPRGTRQGFVGPVHGYDPALARTAAQVRADFQVSPERRLIYLSAGGGSDSRQGLDHLIAALSEDRRNHLLVGYGPLHRGAAAYRENVVPLFAPEIRQWFGGVDAAVSAAGYNSYQELLAARVPTLFYAQNKGMDRQDERIAQGLRQGWHGSLGHDICALEPSEIRARLEEILHGPGRLAILQALERRPVPRGAVRAAVEILSLVTVVERPTLYEAGLHYLANSTPDFGQAHLALRQWWDSQCSAADRESLKEAAVLNWSGQAGLAGHWAELGRWGRLLASLGPSERRELLKAWAYHGARDEARERERLGDALAVLSEQGLLGELGLFLSYLKRPRQKDALLRFAAMLESDRRSDAEALLEVLREGVAIGGLRLEAMLEGETRR